MSKVFIPENYHSQLNLIETEVAIKMIKDYFERRLSEELRLTRVSAPLFLLKNTGLNDDLNGTERPVAFNSYELNNDDENQVNEEEQIFEPADENLKNENKDKEHKDIMLSKVEGAVNNMIQKENNISVNITDTQ